MSSERLVTTSQFLLLRNQSHLPKTKTVYQIYKRLYEYYGPQKWWPAENEFEVMVGAILTQNTNWQNVPKAINNLKKKKLLSVRKITQLSVRQLGQEIKSSGFYRLKAKRLKALVDYLMQKYNDKISAMKKQKLQKLRKELLDIYGIGDETADSILLYALNKPVFVVDAYTKRIFSRHKYFDINLKYRDVAKFFSANLPESIKIYNEYHALLVRLAKDFCRKQPLCASCPIRGF